MENTRLAFDRLLRIDIAEAEAQAKQLTNRPARLESFTEIPGDTITNRNGDGSIKHVRTEPPTYHYEFWIGEEYDL